MTVRPGNAWTTADTFRRHNGPARGSFLSVAMNREKAARRSSAGLPDDQHSRGVSGKTGTSGGARRFDLDDPMTGDDSSDEQFQGVSTSTRKTGLHTSTTDLPREGCGIAAALFR
jgi:hypothetical protein